MIAQLCSLYYSRFKNVRVDSVAQPLVSILTRKKIPAEKFTLGGNHTEKNVLATQHGIFEVMLSSNLAGISPYYLPDQVPELDTFVRRVHGGYPRSC